MGSDDERVPEMPKRRTDAVRDPDGVLGPAPRLTTSDLADRWSKSKRSVRRIPPELLPYVMIGGQRRYRPPDVAAYEERQEVGSEGAGET